MARRSTQNGNTTMDGGELNAFNFEMESDHVVAVMDHFRVKPEATPNFTEHVFKNKKKVYSFKNKEAADVTFVGREKIDKDDNYDYCLAIYNRRTKELEYQPVTMLTFEGHKNVDPEVLLGKEVQQKVNYQADYSMDSGTIADRRRQLTTQFGSEKKIKMLEATLRRQINDDTLTTLSKSTFESENVIKTPGQVDSKLFSPAQSSVLPSFNPHATKPEEIYTTELFHDGWRVQQFGKAAQDFFKKYNDTTKLTALGLQKIVISTAKNVMVSQKNPEQCYLILKLFALSVFIEKMLSPTSKRSKNLTMNDFYNYSIPEAIINDVKDEYFREHVRNGKFSYNLVERDAMISWFLCLYLICNDFKLPQSNETIAVNATASDNENEWEEWEGNYNEANVTETAEVNVTVAEDGSAQIQSNETIAVNATASDNENEWEEWEENYNEANVTETAEVSTNTTATEEGTQAAESTEPAAATTTESATTESASTETAATPVENNDNVSANATVAATTTENNGAQATTETTATETSTNSTSA